jgi:LacI family purine nucleotide synthesis repressor
MRVTIKDIARRANVSPATVSNALNDVPIVNKDTKERVLKIAKEMNYIPNIAGRMLKMSSTKTWGFVTSTLSGPYMFRLVDAMQRECELQGYSLNIIYSRDVQVIKENMLGGIWDGAAVLVGLDLLDEDDLDLFKSTEKPFVFLDRLIDQGNLKSLIFNSYETAYDLCQYLIRRDCKNVLFIVGSRDHKDSIDRLNACKECLKDNGLTLKDENIIFGDYRENITYERVKEYFSKNHNANNIDCIIASNDSSAIGAIHALKELGYRVPEDISVSGFDDIDLASFLNPSLTTVSNPIDLQGHKAIQMLKQMYERRIEVKSEVLKGKCIIRNSTR